MTKKMKKQISKIERARDERREADSIIIEHYFRMDKIISSMEKRTKEFQDLEKQRDDLLKENALLKETISLMSAKNV